MALTNNEKQIRHKQLEELKKYGHEVLVRLIISNSMNYKQLDKKNNAEIQEEIDSIINLPNGWTLEDYKSAIDKLNNLQKPLYDNPYLMNNDIVSGHPITDIDFDIKALKRAEAKAPEVVRNIKSILKLSELNTSDKIAVIAEVMRELAKELLDEKKIPKTFANATSLSLIGHQYEKPNWTWEILAQNIYIQNSPEKAELIASELMNPNISEKGGVVWNN